jgi:hypothetical protein
MKIAWGVFCQRHIAPEIQKLKRPIRAAFLFNRTILRHASDVTRMATSAIDGEMGTIYLGQCNVVVDQPEAELAEIERWRTKSLEHS